MKTSVKALADRLKGRPGVRKLFDMRIKGEDHGSAAVVDLRRGIMALVAGDFIWTLYLIIAQIDAVIEPAIQTPVSIVLWAVYSRVLTLMTLVKVTDERL